MASEVEICNMALYKIGDIKITSLADASKEARACAVFYPLMRDELIYAHPWNFAMTRADISALVSGAPAFEFDYAYTLPADCLRVWELYGSDEEWVVEGGQLLTNQDREIYIRYLKKVTETGKFNPAYVTCLSLTLAAAIAVRLAGDEGRTLRREMLEELNKIAFPAARTLNAMEGRRPRDKDEQAIDEGNYSWQTEGR